MESLDSVDLQSLSTTDIIQIVVLLNTRNGCKFLNGFEDYIATRKLEETVSVLTKRDLLRFLHDLVQDKPRLGSALAKNFLPEVQPVWKQNFQVQSEVPMPIYMKTIKLKLIDLLLCPNIETLAVEKPPDEGPTNKKGGKGGKKDKNKESKKADKKKGKKDKKDKKDKNVPPPVVAKKSLQVRYFVLSGFNDVQIIDELRAVHCPVSLVLEIWQSSPSDFADNIIAMQFSPSSSNFGGDEADYENLLKSIQSTADIKKQHLNYIRRCRLFQLGTELAEPIPTECFKKYNRILDCCPFDCVTATNILDALVDEVCTVLEESEVQVEPVSDARIECVCSLHPNYTQPCRCCCQIRNQTPCYVPFVAHEEDHLEIVANCYKGIGRELAEKSINYLKVLLSQMHIQHTKTCPDRREVLPTETLRNPAKLYDVLYLSIFNSGGSTSMPYKWKEDLSKSIMFQLIPRAYNEFTSFTVHYCVEGDVFLVRFYDDIDDFGICTVSTTQSLRTLVCLRDFYKYWYDQIGREDAARRRLLQAIQELEMTLNMLEPRTDDGTSVPMNTARTDGGDDLGNVIVNVLPPLPNPEPVETAGKAGKKGGKDKKKGKAEKGGKGKKGKKGGKGAVEVVEKSTPEPVLDSFELQRLQELQDLMNYPNSNDLLLENSNKNAAMPVHVYDLGNSGVLLTGSKTVFHSFDGVQITVDSTGLQGDPTRFTLTVTTKNRNSLILTSKRITEQFQFRFTLNTGANIVFTKAAQQASSVESDDNSLQKDLIRQRLTGTKPADFDEDNDEIPLGFRYRSVHTISSLKSTSVLNTVVMQSVRQILPKTLKANVEKQQPSSGAKYQAPHWYDFHMDFPNGTRLCVYTDVGDDLATVEQQLQNGERRIFRSVGEVITRKIDSSIEIQRANGDVVLLEQPVGSRDVDVCHEAFLQYYYSRKVFGTPTMMTLYGAPFWYKSIQPFEGVKWLQKGDSLDKCQQCRNSGFAKVELDFAADEKYFERDDGIRALFHDPDRGCHTVEYPDGGRITSWMEVEDELVTVSTDPSDDGWVSVLIGRRFEHNTYAAVQFDARRQFVQIDLADLRIVCHADGTYTILDEDAKFRVEHDEIEALRQCDECGGRFRCTLNVAPYYHQKPMTSGQQLLESSDSYGKKFTVDFGGNHRVNDNYLRGAINHLGCDHQQFVNAQQLMILNGDLSGTILWTEAMVQQRRTRRKSGASQCTVREHQTGDDQKECIEILTTHYQNYQNRFMRLVPNQPLTLSKYIPRGGHDRHVYYTTVRKLRKMELNVGREVEELLKTCGTELSPVLRKAFTNVVTQCAEQEAAAAKKLQDNVDGKTGKTQKSADQVSDDVAPEVKEAHDRRLNEKIEEYVLKQCECAQFKENLKKGEFPPYFESEYYQQAKEVDVP